MDLCHCHRPHPNRVEGSTIPVCRNCGLWLDWEAWEKDPRVQRKTAKEAETESLVDQIMRRGRK